MRAWGVRAASGTYTSQFIGGGFIGIGWSEIGESLAEVRDRTDLYELMHEKYPDESNFVIGIPSDFQERLGLKPGLVLA